MAYRDDHDTVWGFLLVLCAVLLGVLIVGYLMFYQPVVVDRTPDTIVVPGGAPGPAGPPGQPGPAGPAGRPADSLPSVD